MNKLAKKLMTWRVFTLYVLAFFCVIFLFGTPTENCSILKFFLSLLWTKTLAVGLGYAIYRLYTYWLSKDCEDIKTIEELTKEEDE